VDLQAVAASEYAANEVLPLFEVGLVAVCRQDLDVGELGVVADQREAAVGGGVAADPAGVDVDVEAVARLGRPDVARVLAGPAALLLAHRPLGGLGHGDGHPALRAGGGERRGGGLLGRDAR
jgi:hypothetical protein